MKGISVIVAVALLSPGCRGSSKADGRAISALAERQFCQAVSSVLSTTAQDPNWIEKRTVATMVDSVLFCASDDDQAAARRAMRELERASPACFREPFDKQAQLRASRVVSGHLHRGLMAQASDTRAGLRDRRRFCQRTLRIIERARRAAENPRPDDPDRFVLWMRNGLRPALELCTSDDDHGAVAEARNLLRSAELCAPPAKTSVNADIDKERRGLDMLIRLLRRGSAAAPGDERVK